MNLRQVFVSLLMFGVAGLLLFMYLQAWTEEQNTVSGEKLQQQITVQVAVPCRIVALWVQMCPRVGSTEPVCSLVLVWWEPRNDQLVGKTHTCQIGLHEDFMLPPPETQRKAAQSRHISPGLGRQEVAMMDSQQWQGKADPFGAVAVSLVSRLSDQQKISKSPFSQFREVYLPPVLHPLNKTLVTGDQWKDVDSIQEKRRSFLYEFCKKYNSMKKLRTHLVHVVSRIYVEDRHKVLYCEVPKAGCSNWKRVLMVLNGLATSVHNISHDDVHYGKHLRKLDSYDLKGIYTRLNTYTKTIFVRDPLERLVSAFRDKFEHPNSYYHPVFGKAIIKKYRHNANEEALETGSGVKFKEFIQYLLDSHRPVGMDIHWEQVSKLCYPCLINYDFIGKFETLEEDANYFLQLVGAPAELKFPRFKDRHSSDERTSAEVVRQYLKELSKEERRLTYDFYYLDYLMFNYTSPIV